MGSKRWQRNQRLKCQCMGYWFPHRRTSGACIHSSRRLFYELLRAGVPEAEAMANLSEADLDRFYPLPRVSPSA